MRRYTSMLCLVLMMVVALGGHAVAVPGPLAEVPGASQTAPATEVTPAPSPSPPAPEPEKDFYKQFLGGERALGFNPDSSLFQRVRAQIKEDFVEDTTDIQLLTGVASEVHKLLDQAGVPADQLSSLPVDDNLPEAIVATYGKKVNKDLLWYAMVRGELSSLKDPYSVLMIPEDFKHMMDSMHENTFGGVGIYIELDKNNANRLTIVEPIEDTPAWKAGLQAGDAIVAISGKNTDGMSLDAAAAMLRGEKGSEVVITILRKHETAPQDVHLNRAEIRPISVNSKMLEGGIGYVRLRLFGDRTNAEMQEALQKLKEKGMTSLILDLRNNGGGFIQAAVDICSNFIQPGDLVVSVEPRSGQADEYRAHSYGGPRYKLPMVLLVNAYSASASEITAGCMKDLGIATLVGVKTFGKGSVQNVIHLPQNAALKLTIAHFFSPKHHIIHGVGVTPDIETPMEARLVGRDNDTQLLKAMEVVKSRVGEVK